jgi:hypothetical protein
VDIKKKLNTAKTKIKKYAPEIIIFGSAVAVIAITVHSLKKPIVVPIDKAEKKERKQDDAIHKVTGEDREKIMTDDSFTLYRIDGVTDFYYLNRNLDEN